MNRATEPLWFRRRTSEDPLASPAGRSRNWERPTAEDCKPGVAEFETIKPRFADKLASATLMRRRNRVE